MSIKRLERDAQFAPLSRGVKSDDLFLRKEEVMIRDNSDIAGYAAVCHFLP